MPHSNSAKKRLRQNFKARLRNQSHKTKCRTSRKKMLNALEQGEVENAQQLLKQCVSVFDRAAKAGSISKARADRMKSRLSRKVSEAQKAL